MSVVALALALRNLEGRLARGQSVGQYSRDLLTNAAERLERLEHLTEAGEKLAEDRQVQVDTLLAKVADLELQLVERRTRQDVETEQLRALSARLEEIEPKVDELAARYGRLLVAFHDATRRPLGVTPDSGAEFYDVRMADEAEARASRYGRGRR